MTANKFQCNAQCEAIQIKINKTLLIDIIIPLK